MLVLGIESHVAEKCPGRDPNVMRQMGERLQIFHAPQSQGATGFFCRGANKKHGVLIARSLR